MPYNPPTAKTIKSSGRSTNPSTEVTHSFHCSLQTGTKRTQHFTAGLSWDSANFLLWEHFGSAISTRSSIYLDALEIDCGFFGFSWCRCWCWRRCRCWCCGCRRFLYVLLWCHLVSLKLESKGAPPKKNLKKKTTQNQILKVIPVRGAVVRMSYSLCPGGGPNVLNSIRAYIYFT